MIEATSAQEGIATRPRLICAGWLKRAAARWWRKRQRTAVKSRDEGIPVAARLQEPQADCHGDGQCFARWRSMSGRRCSASSARRPLVQGVSGWCRGGVGGVGGVAVGTGRRFGGLVHSWQWACFCDHSTALYCTLLHSTALYCTLLHSTALYCTIPVDALLWWQYLASMRLLKQARVAVRCVCCRGSLDEQRRRA